MQEDGENRGGGEGKGIDTCEENYGAGGGTADLVHHLLDVEVVACEGDMAVVF